MLPVRAALPQHFSFHLKESDAPGLRQRYTLNRVQMENFTIEDPLWQNHRFMSKSSARRFVKKELVTLRTDSNSGKIGGLRRDNVTSNLFFRCTKTRQRNGNVRTHYHAARNLVERFREFF